MIIKRINNTKTIAAPDTPVLHINSFLLFFSFQEYFMGKRLAFDLPLKLKGTSFQLKVWNALLQIPYGQTCTYKDIAQKVDHPKAVRAVGMANNKNKLMILIPCHRVIGSNNKMVGYAGGIFKKQYR